MTDPTMAPEQKEQEPTENLDEKDKKLAELQNQIKEQENKYLYLYADFENYKKRAIKERSELIKFGTEPLAREMLQVVDNLERAVTHAPENTEKSLIDGLNMVVSQFSNILQKFGVSNIKTEKQSFDPSLHEAVGQEPSSLPAGIIVREHQGGYTLHGRLLRPARVSISSGSSGSTGQPEEKKSAGG